MSRSLSLYAGTFVLLAACCAFGAVRPSFSVDFSSWDATHIVVVTPVSDDGKFQVLESWKGDLLPGATILVPELKPDAESKSVDECVNEIGAHTFTGCTSVPIAFPGSKIVLYLGNTEKPGKPGEWAASNFMGDMKASVAWIQGGDAYGFSQFINPGPSVFAHLGYPLLVADGVKVERLTETNLKEKTFNVLHLRQQVDAATAISDPKTRAEALKSFADTEIRPARLFVVKRLGKCGEAALPTIRLMLDDREFASIADSLVEQYVVAGGASAGPELNSRFEADLRYWQSIAPTLREGWWTTNEEMYAGPHIKRNHYSQTIALIRALDQLHYQPALPTAIHLRDFWRSWPQLSSLPAMADEADQLAKHLQVPGSELGER